MHTLGSLSWLTQQTLRDRQYHFLYTAISGRLLSETVLRALNVEVCFPENPAKQLNTTLCVPYDRSELLVEPPEHQAFNSMSRKSKLTSCMSNSRLSPCPWWFSVTKPNSLRTHRTSTQSCKFFKCVQAHADLFNPFGEIHRAMWRGILSVEDCLCVTIFRTVFSADPCVVSHADVGMSVRNFGRFTSRRTRDYCKGARAVKLQNPHFLLHWLDPSHNITGWDRWSHRRLANPSSSANNCSSPAHVLSQGRNCRLFVGSDHDVSTLAPDSRQCHSSSETLLWSWKGIALDTVNTFPTPIADRTCL